MRQDLVMNDDDVTEVFVFGFVILTATGTAALTATASRARTTKSIGRSPWS